MSQAVVISFLLALTSLQLSTNASRLLGSTAVNSSEPTLASGVNHDLHDSSSQMPVEKEDNADGRHGSTKEKVVGKIVEAPIQDYVFASSNLLRKNATVAESNMQLNISTRLEGEKEVSSDPCGNEIISAGLSMFSHGSSNETAARKPSTKSEVSATDVFPEDEKSVPNKEEGLNLSMLRTASSNGENAGTNSKQLSNTISVETKKKVRFGILSGAPSGPNPGGNSHPPKIRGKKTEVLTKFSDDPESFSEDSSMTVPINGRSPFSGASSHSINAISAADILSTFYTKLTPNPGSGPRRGGN
ncbi:hypothetical protein O6H91_20G013300 [Diphasiastrum complanatum]|uniref:Uncharacterized protein n=1 Tax=Diphasiastrum complanatum TaxID=34168 RepID=A0ACC2AN84_DIPCM|nr:hypothetical protein O6H91_20G013300 [Diphasiastrum complanatum]